jgi:hypothetical protein
MACVEVRSAFSKAFLSDMMEELLARMRGGQFIADQMHFMGMPYVLKHLDHFTDVLAKALQERIPGCRGSEFAYVNDFVAPVNLQNASIHTLRPDNKYSLHIDGGK